MLSSNCFLECEGLVREEGIAYARLGGTQLQVFTRKVVVNWRVGCLIPSPIVLNRRKCNVGARIFANTIPSGCLISLYYPDSHVSLQCVGLGLPLRPQAPPVLKHFKVRSEYFSPRRKTWESHVTYRGFSISGGSNWC